MKTALALLALIMCTTPVFAQGPTAPPGAPPRQPSSDEDGLRAMKSQIEGWLKGVDSPICHSSQKDSIIRTLAANWLRRAYAGAAEDLNQRELRKEVWTATVQVLTENENFESADLKQLRMHWVNAAEKHPDVWRASSTTHRTMQVLRNEALARRMMIGYANSWPEIFADIAISSTKRDSEGVDRTANLEATWKEVERINKQMEERSLAEIRAQVAAEARTKVGANTRRPPPVRRGPAPPAADGLNLPSYLPGFGPEPSPSSNPQVIRPVGGGTFIDNEGNGVVVLPGGIVVPLSTED